MLPVVIVCVTQTVCCY